MKVCIIVFSPSGHTLKVSEKMKEFMLEKGMEVQLLNVTGKRVILKEDSLKEYLNLEVQPHDLICIGGPVYAGHLEGNVKRIISCLPSISKKWGNLAIPFVTYGGLHSSIALKEAGDLLYKSGRKNILGMKIAAFHTLSATLDKQINQGKPDKENDKIIIELVDRAKELIDNSTEIKDIRKSFSYAPLFEKIIFTFLSQNFFHKNYRPVNIDSNKCSGCGTCINRCPVNILELINKRATVANNINKCILCAECFHNCKANAVNYLYYSKVKNRLEKATNLEFPQSAVYPINDKVTL